ncbi:hypothetical protein ACQ1M1_003806 [Escherichia coli]|nr:hypothetical protein [Escherichia marmotae]MBY7386097.1 hypothetical protein [Escherichia marmotae]MBY7484437.1 hypothetical protein [Escherichia marmotae]MBY7544326.1 hypothetical protein [Escherichia marmotae]
MQQLSILPRLSQLCRRESSNFMLDLVHNTNLMLHFRYLQNVK